MMARFGRYAEKVFGLTALIRSLTDSREKPQIPTAAVFLSVFMMCVTRLRSLNALECEMRVPSRWEKIVGRKASADSVARIVDCINSGGLRGVLSEINHSLRRNKVLDESPWALRFVALDGHEFFSQ
jgi:hypothetical protein